MNESYTVSIFNESWQKIDQLMNSSKIVVSLKEFSSDLMELALERFSIFVGNSSAHQLSEAS